MNVATAINLDREGDSDRLIEALNAAGMVAFTWDSGGGIEFECVTISEQDGEWYAVAAGSVGSPCEIGILTSDQDNAPQEPWTRVRSVDEAVSTMKTIYDRHRILI